MPWLVALPLIAAFLYALSAIFLKRVMADGVNRWRVTFASNAVMALGYQLCWPMHTQPFSAIGAEHAAIAACTFFLGQIFTFLALSRGDVSVFTPLIGAKVIWVAIFSMMLLGHTHTAAIWMAVFMTALGAAVLGFERGAHPRHIAFSIGSALATSCFFGMSDVLVQKWAPDWGFGSFIPVMFLVVGLLSFALIPFMGKGGQWSAAWLGPGTVMLAVQALLMGAALTYFGHATKVNIAYNTRGLWSVALVWAFGHWFGNREREAGLGIMLQRLGGAGLLVSAIVIASR
jgi:drug/metabolite transporter (DMT)-like permease